MQQPSNLLGGGAQGTNISTSFQPAASNNSASLFGGLSNMTSSPFGVTQTNTQSLFGNQQQTPSTNPLTGNKPPETSLYNSNQTSSSLFNNNQNSSSLFGNQLNSSSSLFRNELPGTPSVFGNQTNTPLFSSTNQQNTTPSLFGNQQATTPSLFQNKPNTTPFLLGNMQFTTQHSSGNQQTGTSLFGSQPNTAPSLFGNQSSTTPSLFGGQQASTTSPFFKNTLAPGLGTGGTSSLFSNTQQAPGSASQFPLSMQPSGTQSQFNLFGGKDTSAFSGSTLNFNNQQQNALFPFNPNTSSNTANLPIAPEVLQILERLNNADARSCQILTDTFKRLKALATDPPKFIAFTYGIDNNPKSIIEKCNYLEEQIALLNDPKISELYRQTKAKNPDPEKYYIYPIQGFEGMLERVKLQSQHLDQIENILSQIQTRQETITNHLQIRSFRRCQDILKRQDQLMLTVMETFGLVEEFALKHSLAQIDIPFLKKLQQDLNLSIEQFQNSSAGSVALTNATSSLTKFLKSCIPDSNDDPDESLTNVVNKFKQQQQLVLRDRARQVSSLDVSVIKKMIHKIQQLYEKLEMTIYIHTIKAKRLQELVQSSKGLDTNI